MIEFVIQLEAYYRATDPAIKLVSSLPIIAFGFMLADMMFGRRYNDSRIYSVKYPRKGAY